LRTYFRWETRVFRAFPGPSVLPRPPPVTMSGSALRGGLVLRSGRNAFSAHPRRIASAAARVGVRTVNPPSTSAEEHIALGYCPAAGLAPRPQRPPHHPLLRPLRALGGVAQGALAQRLPAGGDLEGDGSPPECLRRGAAA